MDYILQIVGSESENHYQEKILLLGNSIGGFTAASTAAKLQSNYGFNNISLVLVNSAGKIIEAESGDSFFYSFFRFYSLPLIIRNFTQQMLLVYKRRRMICFRLIKDHLLLF